AGGLGDVQGAVGHADDRLPAQRVELLAEEGVAGEADRAGGPHHAALADLEDVLGHARADALGQLDQAVPAEVAGHEQELVAAPPHDDVGGAAAGLEQVPELAPHAPAPA